MSTIQTTSNGVTTVHVLTSELKAAILEHLKETLHTLKRKIRKMERKIQELEETEDQYQRSHDEMAMYDMMWDSYDEKLYKLQRKKKHMTFLRESVETLSTA